MFCPYCGAPAKKIEEVEQQGIEETVTLGFCAVHKAFTASKGRDVDAWFDDQNEGEYDEDTEEENDS